MWRGSIRIPPTAGSRWLTGGPAGSTGEADARSPRAAPWRSASGRSPRVRRRPGRRSLGPAPRSRAVAGGVALRAERPQVGPAGAGAATAPPGDSCGQRFRSGQPPQALIGAPPGKPSSSPVRCGSGLDGAGWCPGRRPPWRGMRWRRGRRLRWRGMRWCRGRRLRWQGMRWARRLDPGHRDLRRLADLRVPSVRMRRPVASSRGVPAAWRFAGAGVSAEAS